MKAQVSNVTELSNDANGYFADQTLADAGYLTLDGALVVDGAGIAAQAQKVSIEGSGNNSGITFTIVGTDADGRPISEALTGANNGTATSTNYFLTVESIYASGAITGNVEGGPLSTNGCVTKSLRVDSEQPDFKVGLYVDISGTLTYSAQYCYMEPEDEYALSYSASADWRDVDGLSSLAVDSQSNLAYPVNACRLLISAYTSGTAKLTATQGY